MAVYFVKNGGSDALSGLSDANAWATLSKVASVAFNPGDQILFKAGSTWREELFFSRSGASGNRIVLGSYGTGAKPIISGGEILTGWTAEASGGSGTGENFTDVSGPRAHAWWLFAETSGNRASSAGTGNNALVPSASPPTKGTGPHGLNSVEFVKASSQQFNLPESGMSATFPGRNSIAAGSITIGGWFRVDAESGSDTGVLSKDTSYQLIVEGGIFQFRMFSAGNATATGSGDSSVYAAGVWKHYVGRWNSVSGEVVLFVNGEKKTPAIMTTRNTWTTDLVIGNATFKSNFDGGIAELFVFDSALTDAQINSIYSSGIDGLRVTAGPTLYYKALASEPGALFYDDIPLPRVLSKVDMPEGTRYWDAANSRMYLRMPGTNTPAAYTIESNVRVYPIRMQTNNWWTIQDLEIRNALKANIFADTNNNAIVQRCTFSYATENGIHIYTHTSLSTTGFDVLDCLAHTNGATGITVAGNFATSMANITIARCETHDNNWNPDFTYVSGIRPIGREINNCIVEDCYVHDEGYDADFSRGCGIWWDTTGLGCVCRRNRIENTTSWGIQLEDVNSMDVCSNVIKGTTYYPSIAIIRNCNNNRIFNNTVVDSWGGFDLSNFNGSAFAGNLIFNNIVTGATGYVVQGINGITTAANADFSDNILGPARSNFINWNGARSSYAAWETAYGGSTNSIPSNPTFVDAAAGDYHLAPGSVGRNAGSTVPSGTLDYTGLAFNIGSPSIGALEVPGSQSYTGTSAVTLPSVRSAAVATRTIPTRTAAIAVIAPKALTLIASTFSIVPRTGTSAVRAILAQIAAAGTRVLPTRTGTSAIMLTKVTAAGLGTVGATTSRIGAMAVWLPSVRTAVTAARTLPDRIGTMLLTLRKFTSTAIGTRIQPEDQPPPIVIGHVLAPPWRTADFGNGTTAVAWSSPLDPGELKAYTINCATELAATSSRIEIVSIILSGMAVVAGLRIYAQSDDDTTITLWLNINPADRGKPNWNDPGETHHITVTITSSAGEIFERDVSLRIKQLGLS